MIVAYIDPGLGALIWQSIVAAIVGFLFYLKKTRCWTVSLFRKILGCGAANTVVHTPLPVETLSAKAANKIEVQ
jgi:hypothetical protein